jgi:hypothetical protein
MIDVCSNRYRMRFYQAVPQVEPVEGVAGVPVVRDLVLPDEADGRH